MSFDLMTSETHPPPTPKPLLGLSAQEAEDLPMSPRESGFESESSSGSSPYEDLHE